MDADSGGRARVQRRPDQLTAAGRPPNEGGRADRAADEVTGRRNRVAVVTDGTAVLGLGDVGPAAALPVMEGKAALFVHLAGIDAVPICLATKHPDEFVSAVRALAPSFGGIDLEAIAPPACFEVERRLQEALDIPVFHDDQHGTAIVVLAALRNALRVVGKRVELARLVVVGAGPAGTATARLLVAGGATDVVVVVRGGVLHHDDMPRLPLHEARLAGLTNRRRVRGGLADALAGADAVVGLSRAGVLTRELVASMGEAPVVFALAAPEPEIRPERVSDIAAVVATGHVDYPNRVDNALAFPGVFRGALDARAPRITMPMRLAAADVLAGLVPREALSTTRLLPEVLDGQVVPTVAGAVAAVAAERRRRVDPAAGGVPRQDAARNVSPQEGVGP
ncbi:NAD(P)-dependent malic enzyme [Micromonospora kangleipakensis]|uniref:NAD(P)-dependent malic enzyme n=1 Tax=Micromonospora kangleipakensis TaxID=1077942 RepID=UPI001029738D|nr:malic enzyme-like NAD(P)-binding protein [Micromonospora kangleipakensis]